MPDRLLYERASAPADQRRWRDGRLPGICPAMTFALVAAALLIGAARPEPGQAAPDFTLESSTGKQISLKDLRGRSVVLAFFPKAFTSG